MENGIYAIRDNVARIFHAPFMALNDEVAIRDFDIACDNDQSPLHYRPGDYDLYHIANFDQLTGQTVGIQPDIIARGFDHGKETDFNEV